MKEIESFKNLLGYFVSHLEYVQTENTTGEGYERYIKPFIDKHGFYKTGQGYNEENIQHQIENWQYIDGNKLCINVQPNFGTYQSKKCYLNFKGTGINIFANWGKGKILSLSVGYFYWWKDEQKYEVLQTWAIKKLDLFVDACSPELNSMYKFYLGEIENYNSQKGKYYLQEKNYDAEQEKQKKMDKYKKHIEILLACKNIVLTGAPGTGKTFMAREIAQVMGAEMKFVQFHPSYDYTDFVEGLRPVDNGNGQMGFERKDGVFKEFCKKAERNLEDSKKSQIELTAEKSLEDKYNEIIYKIENGEINDFKLKTEGKTMEVVKVSDYNNIILRTPGTESDRTYTVSFDRITKLAKAFPNIESLDAITNINDAIRDSIGGCHASSYWAVLKEVYKQGDIIKSEGPTNIEKKPFILIIDEINRGEASKIFGELFYAIDPGYRGKTDVLVQTQYQNLVPESDVFAKGFYVPENVYILATMNDIDRSVESMDFAMRRRFTWQEVTPADTQDMLDSLGCAAEAKKAMNRLNQVIADTDGLGAAYMIGPSYFLKLKDNGGNFDKLWTMNIEPLLKEYLRGFRKASETLERFKAAYYKKEEVTADTSDLFDEEN